MTDTILDIELISDQAREHAQRRAKRNRDIIEMRRRGMTMDAIAHALVPPIKKQRVSQILQIAKRRGVDLTPYPAPSPDNNYHLASAAGLANEMAAWEQASEEDAKEAQ